MKIALVLMIGVFVLAGVAGYLGRVRLKTREAWREGRGGR